MPLRASKLIRLLVCRLELVGATRRISAVSAPDQVARSQLRQVTVAAPGPLALAERDDELAVERPGETMFLVMRSTDPIDAYSYQDHYQGIRVSQSCW